jgi:hypothetical protein
MDQFARARTGVGANSRSVNSLTKMSNIDQQPAVRSSKENGLSTGEGLRPSFIGCHGGIASGRSEPIDPSNIGSGRTMPIFPEAVRLEPYRAPTSSPTRSFISEPIYLSEDCALHQDRHRHALYEASVAESEAAPFDSFLPKLSKASVGKFLSRRNDPPTARTRPSRT